MGATVKALFPPPMRGSIERLPVTTLNLSDLLARTTYPKHYANLPVPTLRILIIPESYLGRASIRIVAGYSELIGVE